MEACGKRIDSLCRELKTNTNRAADLRLGKAMDKEGAGRVLFGLAS